MKQFFKFMLASVAGFFIAGFLIIIFIITIVSSMIGGLKENDKVKISEHSVLQINLEGPIKERTPKNPIEDIGLTGISINKGLGLDDILKSIEAAKTDSKIDGLFINLNSLQTGIATVEEIRNALLDFKTSKKFIYAYSESYSQGEYYLASLADKIYLYPEGDIDFRGFRAELMFLKGTLEKLELQPEVIRHGKFKSAIEPFILDKMSPENREQTQKFISSLWNQFVKDIAESRKLSSEEVQKVADNLGARSGQDALDAKFVDQLAYYDEVLDDLKKKTNLDSDDKVKFVDLKKYSHSLPAIKEFSAKKIAVVYANGEIVSGKGSDDQMGSEKIAEAIRKARLDTTIKAIVLRVNSPGGSALASDVIWRETILAKKAKPLVVSMGDYAASGGYYIACAADKIVAQPTTITGSIGVFGLLFNAQKMFNNKLGITFDSVRTGKYANIGSTFYPMTTEERAIIQESVEKIYDTFITHVSEGRKMDKSAVDSVGQGRVWSGTDAKALGLVDEIGGLDAAIEIAAKLAKLDKHRTISLPEQKDFMKQIMEDFGEEAKISAVKNELGAAYTYYNEVESLVNMEGVQARLPFSITIR
ncbi:MAG: signal peptide peptidase SppA [Bacteroidetes bacterium]|nr:signal peptide peptidase SppA [Bacteroidota bacterium]MBP6427071.1 signal peptide peptidase SppA [Bacteroidia bacterium]MBK7570294.1 signal peptide peptidase SppA [Bacteroidota bacterium]MBK8363581.1 signal peptide peptidase SppA [Bacteroidota bacterium]MBK9414650.1 signal peptide peptidase SppA [Bacteroidota bacterium]